MYKDVTFIIDNFFIFSYVENKPTTVSIGILITDLKMDINKMVCHAKLLFILPFWEISYSLETLYPVQPYHLCSVYSSRLTP